MKRKKTLMIITSIGIIILACSIICKTSYIHYPVDGIEKKIDDADVVDWSESSHDSDMLEASRQFNEVVRLDHLSSYGIFMGIVIIIGCFIGFLSLKNKF